VAATTSDGGLRIVIPRYIAVGVLVALAIGKLSSPYQSHYAIPEWAYFTSAFIELTIAIALAFRAWAAWCLLFFGVGGITFSLLHDGDCG
jgi:hypothetical protein